MQQDIIFFISNNLPQPLSVILLASLPIFELRLAIPVAIFSFKMKPLLVYFLALVGNMIPVIPLLFILKIFFNKLQNMKFIGVFFRWWFASVERRSEVVRRWGFWGLVLFVSIPLPVTGAWTGSVAATLFKFKLRHSFAAIFLGVTIAGFIVSAISLGFNQWYCFGG